MIGTNPAYPEIPVAVSGKAGFRWFLAANELGVWARRAEDFILGGAASDTVEPIKQDTNRLVFRIRGASGDSAPASMIAKAFPMSSLKQRLYRYRRYGPAEAGNLIEAARRNLPVPRVFGLGLRRDFWGVLATVVLMEDIAPRLSVGELIQASAGDSGRQSRILEIVEDLMIRLYRAGCNHIDLNRQSIWIDENLAGDARIIDFQYVRFLERPSMAALMFQAGYFGNWYRELNAGSDLDAMVRRLVEQAGASDVDQWLDLCREYRGPRLSRARRLAIR